MKSEWTEIAAEWRGDLAFSGTNATGGSVQMGDLKVKAGIRPMEMLLLGVAGCTGIDVVNILRKKRQPLEDLRVEVRAKRADDHPRVYTEIEIAYLLTGEGLNSTAVEQAIELSERKYCSASVMLGRTAKISSSYRLISGGDAPSGEH
jgi:putative redox protein